MKSKNIQCPVSKRVEAEVANYLVSLTAGFFSFHKDSSMAPGFKDTKSLTPNLGVRREEREA